MTAASKTCPLCVTHVHLEQFMELNIYSLCFYEYYTLIQKIKGR